MTVADRQTQLGLIHNLVSDPDDEAGCLVYADWLEDRNDPLAELVRVQWEIRRAERAGDSSEELVAHERRLLDGLRFDRPGRSGARQATTTNRARTGTTASTAAWRR